MKRAIILIILSYLVFPDAVFGFENSNTNNRLVINIKKPKHKRKLLFASVAGIVSGQLTKDSLLKIGKVTMVDLQRKYKRLQVVSFMLKLEQSDAKGKWRALKQATVYSLYDGYHFTEEMVKIIKHSYKGQRIEIFVNAIYFDGINWRNIQGIGYGGRVALTLT